MPFPIKGIDYKVLLSLNNVLEALPKGGSFPIKMDYDYAVRKLVKDFYPEYKITIRNTDNSFRVYRIK